MTISATLGEQVRQRAPFACEYCGVTETDAGGQLTVDHCQPQSLAGSDDLSNLLYCCYRCNLSKADYYPGTKFDHTSGEYTSPKRQRGVAAPRAGAWGLCALFGAGVILAGSTWRSSLMEPAAG